MSYVNTAPGVYVKELDKPGPIAGVSTSVVAIVGPALSGEVNTPTLITNWTQFVQKFGDETNNVYSPSPTIYAPFAVRGFFDNGGAMCYFTRVETGPPNNNQNNTKAYKDAIDALKRVQEVNILCVPDETGMEVQKHLIEHCETMQNRFAILDPLRETENEKINSQRDGIGSNSGYAALYYPRIYVANPSGGRILIPPSGHIAGLYARTDTARGVHKAPANETLRGALGLEKVLTDDEQGPFNEAGINALRFFPGRGVVVWGARTVVPKERTQWRYVNVRRLLLYIEESIREGTRFAVFEPNNQALWQTVQRRVADFLTRVWRAGALFGSTPEEAFRVRVDEELNPADQRALGQLVIEVIVYPVTPAEFVEFRVIQQPGGPSVEERS
jgi:uncharacterized protein